jgi:GTPase KRas protein
MHYFNVFAFLHRLQIPIVFVGNKCDLETDRAVSQAEGRAMAETGKHLWLEASAKLNINVDTIFFNLVREINKWRQVHPDKGAKKKKRGCILM